MKRKLAVILVLVLVVSFSILFVSCDTNKSNSKAEYVKDKGYIKIWYDESIFEWNIIHVDAYHEGQFIGMFHTGNGGYLYGQQLTNYDGSCGFVPDTYIYIFPYRRLGEKIKNYDYLSLKICTGYMHDDNGCEVLAEYTISIK